VLAWRLDVVEAFGALIGQVVSGACGVSADNQATRAEARDFCRWIQLAGKPGRPHWRRAEAGMPGQGRGEPAGGARYAAATVAHCETVLRSFYEFHLEAGTGPMVNPFPLARGRRGRANAHRNPMDPFGAERAGRYRPGVPRRIPRQIPDEKFDELFAGLGSHRDQALVAFWVSTGARAAELLGARRADADPGQQLITVIRKGTRALQPLPASLDAFVWLRLYQAQMEGLVPGGPDDPRHHRAGTGGLSGVAAVASGPGPVGGAAAAVPAAAGAGQLGADQPAETAGARKAARAAVPRRPAQPGPRAPPWPDPGAGLAGAAAG
jgi:hypothetical protein